MAQEPVSHIMKCTLILKSVSLVCFVLAALWVFASAPVYAADPEFPELTGRVVDNANLLGDADKNQIMAELETLEAKSSDQLVVVTLKSLQGFEIEEFGYKLGRHWGIGQTDKDNGVLLIIAPNERKVRIEVGRRLEPILTDAVSRIIIENGILPRFRSGDYPGGIKNGVKDIIGILSGDVEEMKLRARAQEDQKDFIALFVTIIWCIIFFGIAWHIIRSIHNGTAPPTKKNGTASSTKKNGSSGWDWSSGNSSGGGWSSDGRGFSGGGGGFGGGGSSGGW